MSATYRASGTGAEATPCVITKPTGVVEGDVMHCEILIDTSISPPTLLSGWELINTNNPDPNDTTSLSTYWKVATASEPSTYSWTVPAAASGIIDAFYDTVGGGTWSLDASPTPPTSTNSATATSASITDTTGGVLVCAYGNDAALTIATPPTSMPTGASELSAQSSLYSFYELVVTGGTGTHVATWSGTDYNMIHAAAFSYAAAGGSALLLLDS